MKNKASEYDGLVIAVSVTEAGCVFFSNKGLETVSGVPPNIWLKITPDNNITVIMGKSEMGQGICTSLPAILADELGADWRQVRFVMSPPGEEYKDPVWGEQTTGGSTSVRHLYEPFRKAGAAARQMLLKAASDIWGVPVRSCGIASGSIWNKKTGERLTFGDLSRKAAELPIPENIRPRKISGQGIIGASPLRLDVPDKVSGAALFGADISVPGMLCAAIARPPAYGAQVLSYDNEAARKTPGVYEIVKNEDYICVLAETQDAAWKGRDALRITWSAGVRPGLNNKSLDRAFIESLDEKGVTARRQGDAAHVFDRAAKKVASTYFLPYLAHAALEPMNCTAHVQRDRCDIWAPTQSQSEVIRAAERLTGLPPERVYVHTTYLGGGFGRRLEVDYAEEAIMLSKIAGRPVKVLWTREEDMRNDFYRPACCCRMEGGIDPEDRFVSWSQKVVAPSIFSRAFPEAIENGVDPAAVQGLAEMEYEVPHILTEYVKIDMPIPIGFWRSVGHSHNAFFVESFVDEVASALKKDPLDFRLELLKHHPRAARVLTEAAERAGWGKAPAPGVGRGIAQHFSFGSYVAQVAEISVEERTGKIRVLRVVCAVDCGEVIHPRIAAAQIEGGIIFGLSAAMKEEVLFEGGGVKTANFNDYRMLRMRETPEIDVHFIESGGKPEGIGEVGVPPIAPAVANAVFNASGIRLRALPMKPEAVLTALAHCRDGKA